MAIKPVEILIKARDEASGIFGSLQSKVAAVGVAIAGYFGFSALAGAIRGAGELEAKLSEVKAVSGATADEMVLLRKAAEDAGASTKYTATEAAEALGNLTRAGLSAKDAIAALPAVLNLAQAGGIELGQASEYVTRAVNGMGLAFSDAGRVADVLAAGANGSNASVKGLAEALSYAAPVAHSVGLSLEATVAIIGKFSDAGIDASRAGTALNAVLSQFSDPSSKFRQELAGAGITTRDFEKALRQLAAAGPAGEKAILAVGTEAGPAMRALMNQGIGALDELKGKLNDAAGSAAATAKVMEDNLPGAMNGLGSAWDTVKNALATPVLPVLKDAVNELAGSLRGAVENGTVGKFGNSLVTAFQAGLKWAREFAGQVDFAALTAKMQGWAESAGATFTKIGEYATNTGNIVQTVFGVMSAGFNSVLAVIYKLAEGFSVVASNIQSGLALLMEGLAKVTFGDVSTSFKLAAEEIRLSAEATGAVSEAFASKASQAFDKAAEGADMAQRGWAGLTAETAKATEKAAASQQVMQTVAATLQEVGKQAEAAGDKALAGAAKQQAAADQARASVAQLRTEYEAALAGGNVQLAVEKMAALQAAIKGVSNEAKKAAETAKDVSDAFTVLRVTSTADLVKQRDAAIQAYKTIRESGLGTAADLQNAWAVVAEKTIAANGGVATEALKSEAAMRGLKVSADEAGKVTIEKMDAAAVATRKLGDAASQAAGDYKKLATAAASVPAAASQPGVSGIGPSGPANKPGGTPTKNSRGETIGAITGTYGLSLPFQLYNKQQAGKLSAADLEDVKHALEVAKFNATLGGPGSVSQEGKADDQKWIGRLTGMLQEIESKTIQDEYDKKQREKREAAAQAKANQAAGKPSDPTPTPTPAPAPASAPPPSTSQPTVVNIYLDSQSWRVRVEGPADVSNLQNMLSQLQAAATRS